MLRARVSKGRRHPFICASCRYELSPGAARRPWHRASWPRQRQSAALPASPRRDARHLSTTAPLCSPPDNGRPLRPGGFPGFLGGGGGALGMFASRANRPEISSLTGTHDAEAQQRTAASAAPAKAPADEAPADEAPADQAPADQAPAASEPEPEPRLQPLNTNPQRARSKRDGLKRGPDEAQATLSRAVLADVFKTNREPRPPPTPKSWSTGHHQPLEGDPSVASMMSTTSPLEGPGLAQTSLGRSGSSWGLFGDRKATLHDPPKAMATDSVGSHRQGWGSFSNRKVQTAERVIKPQLSSESVRPGRQDGAPLLEAKPASDRETLDSKPKADAERNFWAELENRVVAFKGRREKAAAERLPRRLQDQSAPAPARAQAQQSRGRHKAAPEDSQEPRRKSRFEADEEDDLAKDRRRPKKAKKAQKARRMRDDDDDLDEDFVDRLEERRRRKAEKASRKKQERVAIPILVPEYINVSNLAGALKQRLEQFLRDMEEMGFENITPDTILTGDTAALVAAEYGFEPTVDTGSLSDLRPRPPLEDASSLPQRPPVVAIMGHVDHGKTALLDWLRKSSVAAQEHGGITQHIGAFVVEMSSGKQITFLDTPGHAAFLSMRRRGATVTDIVVLVVAADDSVMPQTIEALKHATVAKVPIIVAISKVDKPDARVDQVKADLSRHGVEIEDFGGDVQVVCVSGKTGQGMENLEENIIALSEILDVRAETDGMVEGWILESSVKPVGRAATVLVKRGTLKLGDLIVAGKTWARVRVLRNEAGAELDEAPPGSPVEILGWRDLPVAGDQVLQAPDEVRAKTAVEYRVEMASREESSVQLAEHEQRERERAAAKAAEEAAAASGADGAGDVSPSKPAEPGILYQNFTVKADVVGSVEAVCGSIFELGNHEVQPKVLRSLAGQITEYDVDHAAVSNSVIINFNLPTLPHIRKRADEAKVRILDHNVIYTIVDDVKAVLSELLPMNVLHRVTGEAEVLQVFPINIKRKVFKNIAGCRVRNGVIKKASRVKVLRGGQVVFDGRVETLRQVKKDVAEMGKGSECGIGFDGFDDLQVDDQIQTYDEVKEKRTL